VLETSTLQFPQAKPVYSANVLVAVTKDDVSQQTPVCKVAAKCYPVLHILFLVGQLWASGRGQFMQQLRLGLGFRVRVRVSQLQGLGLGLGNVLGAN